MIGNLGLAFTAPSGVTTIRAMYGGFLIGSGLVFGFAALLPSAQGFGLVAVAIVVGAILISRLIGLIVDRGVSGTQLTYAGIEVASLVLTALCFLLDGRSL